MSGITTRARIFFLHTWRDLRQRVLEQGRPTFSWTLRLTVAATASYAVALAFFDHLPLLAPLTALLITQVTLFSVVRQGIDRVLSVIAGVTIATLFASFLGLSWWTLGLLIAVSLLIGHMMRLGDNLIEVPITAMFVMAVQAGAATAAIDRVITTLIGAAVGLAINIVVPPGVRNNDAGRAVESYGNDLAQLVDNAARQLPAGVTTEQASAWLQGARNLDGAANRIDDLIEHADESRVLNVRALNVPDSGRALRGGLYALEHSSVALRSVFRGISDVVHYPDDVEDPFPESARNMTAEVMTSIARVVKAFGHYVHLRPHDHDHRAEHDLLLALDELATIRKNADNYLRESNDPLAVRELNTFLVASIGRVLREFDLRGHTWANERVAPYADERSRALYAAKRLQARTRELAHGPLRRRRRLDQR